MTNQEKVSVIMPSYNSYKTIGESIESILAQTYTNLELLISDDHSNDGKTIEILKEYEKKDNRVKVFLLEKNGGAGVARNNSIKNATGKFIAFCDSDDRWLPNKLEKQIAFMQEKNCCLCFSSYYTCDFEGKITGQISAPKVLTLKGEKHDNKIGCLTAIYDTSKYGVFYMPKIRKRQDWALFLSIMKKCGKAYAIQEPLSIYRNTPNSISTNKFEMLKYNARVYQYVFGYSTWFSYAYLLLIFMPTYITKKLTSKSRFNKVAE